MLIGLYMLNVVTGTMNKIDFGLKDRMCLIENKYLILKIFHNIFYFVSQEILYFDGVCH